MNLRPLLQALGLLTCVLMLEGCRSTYKPASVPVENWFKRTNLREPKVARPVAKVFSGQVNSTLLNHATSSNTRVVIDIGSQKGYLMVNGAIAVTTPVSTARPGKYTPTGTFQITEKVRSGKISTIYHVAMPYWMRLDDSPLGLHAGDVPGYPASAGCIRLPHDVAPVFFEKTRSGTKVSVYQNWTGG